MKKLILPVLALSLFVATSCSSDDDGGEAGNECQTCVVSALGIDLTTEYCDNGDGTIDATIEGQTTTIDLPEGQSYSQYISAIESAGGTCN
jgi:hypothetical protein